MKKSFELNNTVKILGIAIFLTTIILVCVIISKLNESIKNHTL